jgi:SAM-dependent methyltransferase
MHDNYEKKLVGNAEAFLKSNAGLLANRRVLLLNVSKELSSALNVIGNLNSKVVALGETDEVYDLPLYWRIKYIKASLSEVRFPHSLFDVVAIFTNSSKKLPSEAFAELARISKPNARLYLFLLSEDALEAREDYIKLSGNSFELANDEGSVLVFYNRKAESRRHVNMIYVYHPNLEGDGITEYARHLIYRLRKRGFNVVEGLPQEEDESNFVLVEFEEWLSLLNKIKKLEELPRNSYVEVHSKTLHKPRGDLTYLYHGVPSHYGLDFSGIPWYYVPHIAYEIELPESKKTYDYCSFGFWSRFKHFDQLRKLKGRKKLVTSFNYAMFDDNFINFFKDLCKMKLGHPLDVICGTSLLSSKNLRRLVKLRCSLLRFFNVKVVIKDYIPHDELIRELSECKAFVFFQDTDAPSSGSMRLAAALGVPVYAKDNLRAKEAQVFRFRSLDEIDQLPKDKVKVDDGLDYILSLIEYKA